MYRAYELEKALHTPAKIYYKYEGVSPSGSHKPNTAVAQAYYNKQAGRNVLAKDPNSPGSLGIGISEAIEMATKDENTNYALGSVLNHVLMHQTIIGEEAIIQMEIAGDTPDAITGPFGGGSNFAGISFPFIRKNITGGTNIRCIASEPASCPKLTRGQFRYDFGDTAGTTPLLPMYTLGHEFIPAFIFNHEFRSLQFICSIFMLLITK